MKEELIVLMQYVRTNRDINNYWFNVGANAGDAKWSGASWCTHTLYKYEFDLHCAIRECYPSLPIEFVLRELGG